jgi:glycosyltransferase involved in cell wall biosynthesis
MSRLISVITINYNNANGLQKTIDSVISQSFGDFEFIIIDGKSSDASVDLIKKCSRVNYWESEKDEGIYHAQNKGINKATGDYLLFLNSGDLLANNETLQKIALNLGSADIVYGDLITVNSSGVKKIETSPDKLDVYHFMISTLWHPCSFIKASLFRQYGNYHQELRITGDYEFFLRVILKNKASYRHISLPIAIFDMTGVSNNPENRKLQSEERKKSWLMNFSPFQVKLFESYTKILRRLGRK